MPMSLSAHPAADSSLPGVSDRGVYVTWAKPVKVLGGEVTGYNIERMVAGEDTLTDSVDGDRTFYQDTDNLGDQVREYRVSAESDGGSGPWTAWVSYPLADHTHNNMPTTVGSIDDIMMTVGDMPSTMDVMGYFNDADGDTLTYTAMSDMEMYATADIPAGSSMLTVTAVSVGTAEITVTADDGNGGMVYQKFMVTVAAAPIELTAPTIKSTNPVGSGITLVSWDAVPGATGYTLIAVNLTDRSAPTRTAAADADDESGQIQNLTVDDEYLIFVGAFNDDLEYKLSAYVRITAE